MNFLTGLKVSLKKFSSKNHSWIPLTVLALLLIAIPITLKGLITGRFETRRRALSGEITPPPSCPGVISVTEYTRADLTPGLKINVTSNTPYQNTSLKIIPEGSGGAFIEGPPAVNLNIAPYRWYWQTSKPMADNFRVEFYLINTGGYQPCGQWNSSQSLRFKLRFTGITSRPSDDGDKPVQIYATSNDGGEALASASDKQVINLNVDDSGIYHGEISLNDNYFNHHYRLRIKGPKHLQAVFVDVFFQPNTELDLTDQPLKPGDLNADSKVDSGDIQIINDRIFSNSPTAIKLADVNFDQKVDIIDRTLVLNTLSVHYDPN